MGSGSTEMARIAQEAGAIGAREAVLEMSRNPDVLSRIAIEAQKWYSADDIATITGYTAKTVKTWMKSGVIRGFQVDGGKWRITKIMWREDERRLIETGVLNVYPES